MLRISLALALAAALAGCLHSRDPELQMGPDAQVTPDGLHRVDHVPFGTLYMRPDYTFGSYKFFVMGKTHVTFRRGSRVLSEVEIAELRRRFDAVARKVIAAGGRIEVEEPGPCVARINLGLVDVDLLDPKDLTSHGTTTVLDSFGSLTLVLEIRDGYTAESLLRYGRRRKLEGGPGTGVDPAELAALTTTLEDFARGIESDFQRALPHLASASSRSCEERAGLPPPVGNR
jgi:hypothetical protein